MDNEARIYTYRKGSSVPLENTIKNTSVQSNFYSQTAEKILANQIENPAVGPIKKIRNGQPVTPDERSVLAQYALNFASRVQRGKMRLKSLIPQIAANVFSSENLRELNRGRQLSAKQKEQVDKLRWKWENENELTEELWFSLLSPNSFRKSLATLEQMTWQFLTYYKVPAFITSDNPFFFFPHIGIGNELSEVIFPLSQNVVLWATKDKELSEDFFPVSEEIVSEINRRIASQATHEVFFSRNAGWVSNLINQPKYDLHRIVVHRQQHILNPFNSKR
jgi:hypothetical protein